MKTDFIEIAQQQFKTYKGLGEKAMAQTEEANLFLQAHADSNSIAIVVQHLWGNMLSRWTDFLTTDGEKEWRKREEEFEPILQTRATVLAKWEDGWECLFDALEGLNETDLTRVIYIRGEAHSVKEAIARQLTHYAYHVGQIVFISRMLNTTNFQSLSIPKGGTAVYNQGKFNKQ
jgi:hypothetical protein